MAEAVAPVSFTASLTLAKTGRSRWVVPAFLGLVPPTTFVPVLCELLFVAIVLKARFTVGDGLLSVEAVFKVKCQPTAREIFREFAGFALTFPAFQ